MQPCRLLWQELLVPGFGKIRVFAYASGAANTVASRAIRTNDAVDMAFLPIRMCIPSDVRSAGTRRPPHTVSAGWAAITQFLRCN
ncbi:hypothetical protein GCM10009105_36950 [Dokdonella soli]|uniref:Uncharacterized protein n=1 Tax=Dokdonella soli TaxID=529810 RepID=A0ABN1IZE6_9GAMM